MLSQKKSYERLRIKMMRGLMLFVMISATWVTVLPQSAAPVQAASAVAAPVAQTAFNVTGTVFRDFNSDGLITTGTVSDIGLADVTVTAYDSTGAAVGSTTTNSSGVYSLTPSTAGPYRIEFTNLPDGYEPSSSGSNVRTSVRFVTSSADNPVHLGVNHPCDYCQTSNPTVQGVWHVNGNQVSSPSLATVVSFPYNSHTDPAPSSSAVTAPTTELTDDETGSIWGMAYQRTLDQKFYAAYFRRHVALLNGRTGAIYSPEATGGLYIDLATLGIDTGADTRVPTVGVVDDPNELPASSIDPSWDAAAYPLVGKRGLGDIDIDGNNTMWIVNMELGSLHGITNVDATVTPTAADLLGGTTGYPLNATTTGVTCTNGVLRPFGLETYRDKVYVGAVCSGENTGATLANVSGHVFSFDPANPGTFTEEVGFTFPATRPFFKTTTTTSNTPWVPWVTVDNNLNWGSTTNPEHSTPMLSDIEFTATGNMIIGIRSRFSDQTGPENYFPDPTASNQNLTFDDMTVHGDILHACKTATGWAYQGTADCPISGSEFYTGDYGPQALTSVTFLENSLGSLVVLPGSGEVMSTAFDAARWHSGGVFRLDTGDGTRVDQYAWYPETRPTAAGPYFTKTGGLGDLEILCDPAPIEIGNRLWLDSNADGIQDADEAGISNVTVTLWADTDGDDVVDTQVGTATTSASGQYFFGGVNDTNMTGGNSVNPYTAYEIRVDTTQTPLVGYGPTLTDAAQPANGDVAASSNDPIADVADSDATPSGDTAVIAYTTEGAGFNNHGLDIGFTPTVSVGSFVWEDTNDDGVQDSGEPAISGATVELLDSSGNPANDASGNPVASQTTGADGLYYFDNLAPGDYIVQVTPPSGYAPSSVQSTGAIDGSTSTNVVETDSNIATESSPGVYRSGIVTLTTGSEPTEAGTAAGDGQDDVDDTSGNMTVDFGFTPTVSLGSFVWEDTDNDGAQDAGEPAISGATVELLDSNGDPANDADGNPVTSQTTAADGLYFFDNLLPGDYIVQVTPPSGYAPSSVQSTGAIDGSTSTNVVETDSNIATESSPGVYRSGIVTLTAGSEPTEAGTAAGDGQDDVDDTNGNMTVDFGFTMSVAMSIGSYIWEDFNNNGAQEFGEPGIAGATVSLLVDNGSGTFIPALDADGNTVTDQVTVSNGLYYFDNLPEGTYKIRVTPPADATPSTSQTTTNDDDTANDSNIASESSPGVYDSTTLVLAAGAEPTETGGYAGDTQDSADEANGNMTLDMGFWFVPELAILKVLNSPAPVRTGDPISFTITITNTGASTIDVLPLEDTYNPSYLGYVDASPASDDNTDDGTINWTDLTVSLGSDLAPGATVSVTVNFIAMRDTGLLPNQATVNNADVIDAQDTNGNAPPDVSDSAEVENIAPTAVYLSSRSMVRSGSDVTLLWTTVDEANIAAFRVIRTNADQTEVLLTPDAVPAEFAGQSRGMSYSVIDTDLDGQSRAHYDLEIIALDGATNRLDLGQFSIFTSSYLPMVSR